MKGKRIAGFPEMEDTTTMTPVRDKVLGRRKTNSFSPHTSSILDNSYLLWNQNTWATETMTSLCINGAFSKLSSSHLQTLLACSFVFIL
jgi:hypothetical protein